MKEAWQQPLLTTLDVKETAFFWDWWKWLLGGGKGGGGQPGGGDDENGGGFGS